MKNINSIGLNEEINNNNHIELKPKIFRGFRIKINFLLKLLMLILIICLAVIIVFKFKIGKKRMIKKIKKIRKVKTKKNIIKENKIQKENVNNTYFACFVGIGREENKYSRELIDYYLKLGVEKFIFADNNLPNSEKLADVLQDYISKGTVDIYEIFGSSMGQAELFNITYEKYRNQCNWFLMLDFDEFLEVHFEKNKSLSLKEFLTNSTFDKCEAILFNWLIYSDNDLVYYDKRPMLERFTDPYYGTRANIFVKSVVRGGLNKKVFLKGNSNHVPERGVTICDSKGNIIPYYHPYTVSPPVHEYGYIKHFTTKTAEEFCDKIIKGHPTNTHLIPEARVKLFFEYNKFSQEKLKVFEKRFNRVFNPIGDRRYFRGNN